MTNILTLNDGKSSTVFSTDDFADLVLDYMGYEAAVYYQAQIRRLVSCIKDIDLCSKEKHVKEYAEEVLKEYGIE